MDRGVFLFDARKNHQIRSIKKQDPIPQNDNKN